MYRIPKYRINLIREATVPFESKRFSNSRDVFKTFRDEMLTYDREHFLAVMLDAKNNIIGVNDVSIGSLSTSVVHPRLCAAAHKRGYVASAVMLRTLGRRAE